MNPEPGPEEQKPIPSAAAGEPLPGPGDLDDYLRDLLALPPVKPWPEPVDGCKLLDEIMEAIGRVVVLKAGDKRARSGDPFRCRVNLG
jgi:hypothetical protein